MAEMNMGEYPISKIIKLIEGDLDDGDYSPILILGPAGVGKTVAIHGLAKNLGIGYKEVRLVYMSEVDMLGLPQVEEKKWKKKDENGNLVDATTKATTYAASSQFPTEADGEVGILALDEITSAQSSVRAAAYQLLDSKRALGDYKLPDKWKVIALGNGPNDGGVYNGLEGAFISRCKSMRVVPNKDSWLEWAADAGINPSVMAYIKFEATSLYRTQDEIDNMDDDVQVFRCPRTWELLSTKLNAREKKKGSMLDPDDVEMYAAVLVGVTTASAFKTFYQFNDKILDVNEILSGKAYKENNYTGMQGGGEACYLTLDKAMAVFKEHCSDVFNSITQTGSGATMRNQQTQAALLATLRSPDASNSDKKDKILNLWRESLNFAIWVANGKKVGKIRGDAVTMLYTQFAKDTIFTTFVTATNKKTFEKAGILTKDIIELDKTFSGLLGYLTAESLL